MVQLLFGYLRNSPNRAYNDGWNDKEEAKRNPPCGIRLKRAGSPAYTVDYKTTGLGVNVSWRLFRIWRVSYKNEPLD